MTPSLPAASIRFTPVSGKRWSMTCPRKYRLIRRLIGVAVATAMALPLTAQAVSDADRQAFAQALEAIESGERTTLPTGLKEHPLYPYLESKLLRRQIWKSPGDATDLAIIDWLDRHGDLPLADDFRADWLMSLPKRGEWARLHQHYQPTRRGTLNCHYLHARIRLEPKPAVLADARAQYVVGKSQPDACDPVFDWLEDEGKLTVEMLRKRIMLAIDAGQPGLVRYLVKQLPAKDSTRAFANSWLEMRQGSARYLGKVIRSGRLPKADEPIVAEAFNRLSRFDSARAWDEIVAFSQVFEDRKTLIVRARRDIALGLAYDRDARAIPMFRSVPTAMLGPSSREWRVRSALYYQDWDQARRWILDMPEDQRESETWQYWLARAEAATGRAAQARNRFRQVAQDRSYYGYLAADELDLPYAMNHVRAPVDADAQARFRRLAGTVRAREWWLIDRPREARQEWKAVTKDLQRKDLMQAALVAHGWGWHEQAIITLAQSKYWADLDVRYPLPYSNEVIRLASEFGITPEDIWAITRSESLFARDARSYAGARGLMQLMPATAREVARKDGLRYAGVDDLYTPDINLRLGTRYLAQLLERYDGSLALAAAAYNAGPHRVDRWKPDYPIETAIWAENIPFNATRDYVQKVLKHATGFHWQRTGHPMRVSLRLGDIEAETEVAE